MSTTYASYDEIVLCNYKLSKEVERLRSVIEQIVSDGTVALNQMTPPHLAPLPTKTKEK